MLRGDAATPDSSGQRGQAGEGDRQRSGKVSAPTRAWRLAAGLVEKTCQPIAIALGVPLPDSLIEDSVGPAWIH
jgi:hypothetical protein